MTPHVRRLSLFQSRTVRGHLGERDRVLGQESHGPFGRKVRDLQDAGPRPRGTGQALVSVSNTGRPVAPAEVDRLFQPFQRLDGERIQHSGGYGLGLAIVRAIAGAHGTALTANARAGGGLDIEVSFP
jgi:signal transduction histidine kinase